MERIKWIDGLKGLACICIFLHHFSLAFYPASYYGEAAASHVSFDVAFSQSPFSCFVNGNFLVHIFCMLSGIVLALPLIDNIEMNKLSKNMFKRYFRLSLPVFAISIIVFLMMCGSLFANVECASITSSPWLARYYTEKLTLNDVLTSSFITVWLNGDNRFSNAFWMLPNILSGTFLIYIFSIIFYRRKKRTLCFLIIPIIMFLYNNSLMLCFVLGFLVAYFIKCNPIKSKVIETIVGLSCVIVGLFFGGYPTGVIPDNIYAIFNCLPENINASTFWHTIGAALLISGVSLLFLLKKLLGLKFFIWLGSISFAVFLTHNPILFSFSTSLFNVLMENNGRYKLNTVIVLVASIAMLLLFSWLFHITDEKMCDKIVTFVVKKLYKNNIE